MDTPQPTSPRQRLKELLAIPERQRTDAQWDEINELEIQLAAGNRQDAPPQGGQPHAPTTPGHGRPGGSQGKKPFKRFHKKRTGGGAS
jgi:hypothetical protein